jgi:oxepin-CoA hydrolase/3-oxo-5,6-dehydrosuberyl-CoA semialdehyde dehydrogenase
MKIKSYARGKWVEGSANFRAVYNAVSGEKVGDVSSEGLDFKAMLEYGRKVGGPKLRKMTFHQRGRMIKQLALYLNERRKEFYPVSAKTGATANDTWLDIDGGIGTLFVFASKARRELPDEPFYVDGDMEMLSRNGTFVGRHICVPLQGTAVHINAFNFPCWGMLEKLAPTLIAGMPAIFKPASSTCYVTEAVVKAIIESAILPEGALQLICGGVGDMLDFLGGQDVVTLTGSASTGKKLRQLPSIVDNSVRFNMEADSLNCSILGLFIKEVAKEMTIKAGQRCTAIRRTIVPQKMISDVMAALKKRLDSIKLGDPALEEVRMGPLVNRGQVQEVRNVVMQLQSETELVYGDPDNFEITGGDKEKGAFFPATLLYCENPFKNTAPHNLEPFGPVSTVMPYKTLDEAVELAKMGKGSLVGSLFTADDDVAREVVLGSAALHGRIMIVNQHCAKESTGHGSPLPHMVHGGPGRAGGGEELGGIRSVLHYMQRTALQGSPTTLTRITNEWMKGAAQPGDRIHPFRKYFEELQIGETLTTHRRTVTEADLVHFAGISGDYFYQTAGGARVFHHFCRCRFVCLAGRGPGAGQLRDGEPPFHRTGLHRRYHLPQSDLQAQNRKRTPRRRTAPGCGRMGGGNF